MTDFMKDELGAPNIVDRAKFQAELEALQGSREGAHARGRRNRGRSPAAPYGRGGRHYNADWPAGPGDAARHIRGPPPADRLLLHVARRPPCAGAVRGMHLGYQRRFASCPTSILATSPTPRSAKVPTKRVPGIASSWAGRCPGTRHLESSLDTLLVGRRVGRMHIVCYLRQGSKVFETYWTTSRGVEVMDNNYHLLDLTVYGRQEKWEDSPAGWPQQCTITRTRTGPPTWEPEWPGGRPIAQWPRLEAGYSDDLGTGRS